MPPCAGCASARAALKRPRDGTALCRDCFFVAFEDEIHKAISEAAIFRRGDRVAVGVSGGKDSAALAHVLTTLNARHDYGIEILLLAIDEGIAGYRDDSLEALKRSRAQLPVTPPLLVLSYRDLYGWSMDDIVKAVGTRSNCTFCGVFRRQALDRGARMLQAQHIVTGHNADDVAETVLMNLFRGDFARLQRCTAISSTGADGIKRSKPFKYMYQKEIVMYAYFKRLHYFSTECTYAVNAFRGHARTLLCDLASVRPGVILDIIKSGDSFALKGAADSPPAIDCERCGYASLQSVCKACVMLEGLERGIPRLGLGKTSVLRRKHGINKVIGAP